MALFLCAQCKGRLISFPQKFHLHHHGASWINEAFLAVPPLVSASLLRGAVSLRVSQLLPVPLPSFQGSCRVSRRSSHLLSVHMSHAQIERGVSQPQTRRPRDALPAASDSSAGPGAKGAETPIEFLKRLRRAQRRKKGSGDLDASLSPHEVLSLLQTARAQLPLMSLSQLRELVESFVFLSQSFRVQLQSAGPALMLRLRRPQQGLETSGSSISARGIPEAPSLTDFAKGTCLSPPFVANAVCLPQPPRPPCRDARLHPDARRSPCAAAAAQKLLGSLREALERAVRLSQGEGHALAESLCAADESVKGRDEAARTVGASRELVSILSSLRRMGVWCPAFVQWLGLFLQRETALKALSLKDLAVLLDAFAEAETRRRRFLRRRAAGTDRRTGGDHCLLSEISYGDAESCRSVVSTNGETASGRVLEKLAAAQHKSVLTLCRASQRRMRELFRECRMQMHPLPDISFGGSTPKKTSGESAQPSRETAPARLSVVECLSLNPRSLALLLGALARLEEFDFQVSRHLISVCIRQLVRRERRLRRQLPAKWEGMQCASSLASPADLFGVFLGTLRLLHRLAKAAVAPEEARKSEALSRRRVECLHVLSSALPVVCATELRQLVGSVLADLSLRETVLLLSGAADLIKIFSRLSRRRTEVNCEAGNEPGDRRIPSSSEAAIKETGNELKAVRLAASRMTPLCRAALLRARASGFFEMNLKDAERVLEAARVVDTMQRRVPTRETRFEAKKAFAKGFEGQTAEEAPEPLVAQLLLSESFQTRLADLIPAPEGGLGCRGLQTLKEKSQVVGLLEALIRTALDLSPKSAAANERLLLRPWKGRRACEGPAAEAEVDECSDAADGDLCVKNFRQEKEWRTAARAVAWRLAQVRRGVAVALLGFRGVDKEAVGECPIQTQCRP